MECSMEAFEDDHELLKNVEDGFEIASIKNSKLYEVQSIILNQNEES